MIKKMTAIINKNQDGKRLASNFGYLLLLQIAGYVFPLFTIPYLARVIGVDGFGKIAFAAAVIVWLQTITDWGFNYTATRDIAQNRDDPNKVSEIFSNVFWARLFLMAASFLVLCLAILIVPYFQENKLILLLTFLLVPGHVLFPEWFFQAMERMKYITIFNLVSKFVFTAMVFVFIDSAEDYLLQPVLMSIGYVVCGIFSMYLIIVKWRITIQRPQRKNILLAIKNSFHVFFNNLMPNLYNGFSVLLLGFYGGSAANGIFDAGKKFIEIAQQFLMVISRTFFPFLSRKINKHGFYVRLQLGFAVAFAVFLYFSAPYIINVFFTAEFESAVYVLQIMSVSLVFLSLNNIYGANYMIIKGYDKTLRNITFWVSIVGFMLAFPLVLYYDYVGAAFTITITRALLGLAVMFKSMEIKRKEIIK